MPKVSLITDLFIKNELKKGHKDSNFGETSARGQGNFAIRFRGDKAEFYIRYHSGGKRSSIKLGNYPCMQLRDARDRYNELSGLIARGIDPKVKIQNDEFDAKAKREAALAQERADAAKGSLGELLEHYLWVLEKRGSPPESVKNIRSAFEHDVFPVISRSEKAREVTLQQLRSVLMRIVARGSSAQANHVRSYLMAAFNEGIKCDNSIELRVKNVTFGLAGNPARDVPKAIESGTGVRDVELNTGEIKLLWNAGGMSPFMHNALRLILATGGQRVRMIIDSKWCEVDFDSCVWSIPLDRRKNRKSRHIVGAHKVPLNSVAIELLEQLRSLSGEYEYIFPRELITNRPNQPAELPHMRMDSLNQSLKKWMKKNKFPR
ncbi:MAG: integrase arm-type DNA-binding domain-containing protein [Methylococcales bacterium]|jgi:integrase|nr:integrase arm-type DNA-binding domain-containing protein [Methylococcales bacterium]MBT7445994.1 integrase arm-type DNA-binding domain-containing protein [Methylococcales bacterium]